MSDPAGSQQLQPNLQEIAHLFLYFQPPHQTRDQKLPPHQYRPERLRHDHPLAREQQSQQRLWRRSEQ